MEHPAIQQYNYHKWANTRIFEHLKSLPAELYNNEIQSVFSSIQEVIIHAYHAEGMWLSVMSGCQLIIFFIFTTYNEGIITVTFFIYPEPNNPKPGC